MGAARKPRWEWERSDAGLYIPERRRQALYLLRERDEPLVSLVAQPTVTAQASGANDTAVSSFTLGAPGGTAPTSGKFCAVWINFKNNAASNPSISTGTGNAWTIQSAIGGTNRNQCFYWKIANGTEPTSWTATMGASQTSAYTYAILIISGADNVDVTGAAQAILTNTPNASSITETRCNDLVIAAFGNVFSTSVTSAATPPAGWSLVTYVGTASGVGATVICTKDTTGDVGFVTGACTITYAVTSGTATSSTRLQSISPPQTRATSSMAAAQASCSVTVAEIFTSANAASGSQATSSETVAEVFTSANASAGAQGTSSETGAEAFSSANDSAAPAASSSENVAEVFSSANASNGADASSTSTVAEVFNSPVALIAIQAAANLTGGETFTAAMAGAASQGALAALVVTFVGVLVSSLGQQGSSALSGIEGFAGTLTPTGQSAASLVIGFEGFGVAVASQGAQALLSALIYRYWRTDGSHGQTVQRVFSGFVTQHVFGTTPNPTARKTNA